MQSFNYQYRIISSRAFYLYRQMKLLKYSTAPVSLKTHTNLLRATITTDPEICYQSYHPLPTEPNHPPTSSSHSAMKYYIVLIFLFLQLALQVTSLPARGAFDADLEGYTEVSDVGLNKQLLIPGEQILYLCEPSGGSPTIGDAIGCTGKVKAMGDSELFIPVEFKYPCNTVATFGSAIVDTCHTMGNNMWPSVIARSADIILTHCSNMGLGRVGGIVHFKKADQKVRIIHS